MGTARAPGESPSAQGRDLNIFQPLDVTAAADVAMPASEKPSKRSFPAFKIDGDPENLDSSKVARSKRGEALTASLITPARMPLGNLGLNAGNSEYSPFLAVAGDSGYEQTETDAAHTQEDASSIQAILDSGTIE